MDFSSIVNKIKGLFGGKVEDLGLKTVIEKLQQLVGGADEGDKAGLNEIITTLKKALGNKADLNNILKQATSLVGKLGNGNLKETVEKLLKTIAK